MTKKPFLPLILLLFLALCPVFARAWESADTCPQAILLQGKLDGVKDAPAYAEPDRQSGVAFRVEKGDECEITGQVAGFYRVEINGKTGYVNRHALKTKGVARDGALPETALSDVSMDDYLPTLLQAKEMPLKGSVTAASPMDTLFFYVWDERQQRVEFTAVIALKEAAETVSLAPYHNSLKPAKLTAGRKTLLFQAGGSEGLSVVCRLPMYVRGAFRDARHITDQCRVSGNGVSGWGEKTVWVPSKARPSLLITLPADGSAALMTLDWWLPPDETLIEFLDKDGEVTEAQTLSTGFYLDTVALNPDIRQVRVTPKGSELKLKILRVYDGNYARSVVQAWQPVPKKVDLMVFSAHQDDELLFLGGTLASACAQGRDVAMVYMTNGGRSRYREAMDGLWTAGLRTHPIFLNWRDQKVKSLKTARKTWYMNGHDPVGELVALIRRYKPDVIVTQDLDGEYGHTQHKLTAILLTEAVALTADPANYPGSAEAYGAWEVKKLYLHLYKENQITMDWNQPLDDTGVITPMFLTREAYDKHRSQQSAYNIVTDGRRYNNALFGLYYSAVGPDTAKNDFFENIPAD